LHAAALLGRLGWILLLGLVAARTALADSGFTVESVETRLVDGVYRLDARVRIDLSRSVRRALDSGVPITLLFQIRVLRPRDYLWDAQVANLSQRFRIEYHALSKRFVLTNVNTGAGQAFRTLEGALEPLQRLHDFPLVDASLLPPGPRYVGELTVLLDSESLPAPLRLQTWVNDAWRLSSSAFRWPLAP
jgi:hypothetical protein